ncbi:hypothetical protein [Kerstersia gyiorum]|uniref:Uncharacterized protein n=1 Tax=Kerstersia gyiorum TaxID=206506 RepID=A0A171KNB8_9BURK|nr:hypothetical protein [Kerstersia gyiorum]KKO70385.1 hypothetical protein AAV32_16770 [Kerstersia gyiorum]
MISSKPPRSRHARLAAQPSAIPALRPTILHTSLTLLGATLLSGLTPPVHAFTPNPAFAPTVVLPFTGTEGNAPGAQPLAPPVYVSADQRLYGSTQHGGFPYSDRYGEITFGGVVLYSLNPAAPADSYKAFRTQGELSRFQQLLPYWDEATRTLYSASSYITDPSGNGQSYMGLIYGLRAGTDVNVAPTAITLQQPGTEMLTATQHKPSGQMAVGKDGYAYYNAANLAGQCYEAGVSNYTWNAELNHHPTLYGKSNLTYRIKLGEEGAQPEAFANWCDFAQAYIFLQQDTRPTRQKVKREYHPFGSAPTHFLLGDDGKFMYAISQFDTSTNLYLGKHNQPEILAGETIPANYPSYDYNGIPANDNKGIPGAALIRINLEALKGAALGPEHADKVEVLHWFALNAHGGQLAHPATTGNGVALTGSYINSLVEVGDWIYGNNQTVWRFYKGNDASVTERFQIVHDFNSGIEDDGSQPSGPLVLAADGNLYGTTYSDKRVASNGEQAKTGTLFRLVIDPTYPDAAPSYEPLQYLDLNTVGAQPTGLSAGEFTAISQRLYGATQLSANAADASTPLQRGAIFSVDVPLPTVFAQDLSASATQLAAGGTLTLKWKAENAASCEATGDNNNLWQGAKALDGSNGIQLTLDHAGTYTFGLDCVRSFGGPNAASATATVVVTATSSEPGGGNGNGTDNGGSGGGALGHLALLALGLLGLQRHQRTRRLD